MPDSSEADRLLTELRFLVDEHGLSQAVPEFDVRWEGIRTRYEGVAFRVEASYNCRESHSIEFTYSSNPAAMSLATLIAGLSRDQRAIDPLTVQASFLRAHWGHLLTPPVGVLADWRALRFYHAPEYRKGWGTTIQMTAEEITAERARLDRLRAYFE